RAARPYRLAGARLHRLLLERVRRRKGGATRRADGFSAAAEILRRARYRLEQVGPQDFPWAVEPRFRHRVRRAPWRHEAAATCTLRIADVEPGAGVVARLRDGDRGGADSRLAGHRGGPLGAWRR